MEDDLDDRIADFLDAAQPASIDIGSLAKNAEGMGLARGHGSRNRP
jgi:hypothetical protein